MSRMVIAHVLSSFGLGGQERVALIVWRHPPSEHRSERGLLQ